MYLKRNLIIVSTLVYVLGSFAIADDLGNVQDLAIEKLFERALETRGDEYARR
jgi:hypothetical protein